MGNQLKDRFQRLRGGNRGGLLSRIRNGVTSAISILKNIFGRSNVVGGTSDYMDFVEKYAFEELYAHIQNDTAEIEAKPGARSLSAKEISVQIAYMEFEMPQSRPYQDSAIPAPPFTRPAYSTNFANLWGRKRQLSNNWLGRLFGGGSNNNGGAGNRGSNGGSSGGISDLVSNLAPVAQLDLNRLRACQTLSECQAAIPRAGVFAPVHGFIDGLRQQLAAGGAGGGQSLCQCLDVGGLPECKQFATLKEVLTRIQAVICSGGGGGGGGGGTDGVRTDGDGDGDGNGDGDTADEPRCPPNMINPLACGCGLQSQIVDGCPQPSCKPCELDGGGGGGTGGGGTGGGGGSGGGGATSGAWDSFGRIGDPTTIPSPDDPWK